MSADTKVAIDYTIPHNSINEAGAYGRQALLPASTNEPPLYPAAVPNLTSLVPSTTAAGGNNRVTIQIMGTGFGPWSAVTFNGAGTPLTLVTSTQLNIMVNPKSLSAGSYPVKVINGSFSSNTLNLTLT